MRHLLLDRSHDPGMRVPDHHRSGAEQVVDVLVAADVPYPGAASLLDDEVGRQIAEASARHDAVSSFYQCALFVAAFFW